MEQNLRTTKRRWFKLYPNECLNSSIRWQLSSAERGVWYDLLAFSAISSNIGLIADRDGKPLPHSFLANRLNIDLELLESALAKCIEERRITEDDGGIHITNWKIYQSEYDRQKPYRQKRGDEYIPGTNIKKDDPDKYIKGKFGHMVKR